MLDETSENIPAEIDVIKNTNALIFITSSEHTQMVVDI